MDNKMYSLNTDELENKIEINIDGIIFEIKNVQSTNYYKNIDSDNVNIVDVEIEKIIGENSIEKINNARKQRGKEELDLGIKLNLLLKLIGIYNVATTNNVSNTAYKVVEDTNNAINNITKKYGNRQQRRTHNNYKNYRYRRY